jgi:hypothetical protein
MKAIEVRGTFAREKRGKRIHGALDCLELTDRLVTTYSRDLTF